MTMAVTQQRSFTIEIEDQLCDSYKNLGCMQKKRVLCDVTLVAKDVEIPAHKNILASCSPYFYSMFTNYQTAKEERIPLDVNPQILLSVVNYMYSSSLTVLEENIMDLLEVSKMLVLNGIEAECYNILKHIMDPNNCFRIKSVAAQYEQSDLLNIASSYIDDNFVDVVTSEGFLDLTSDEVSELISKDTLKVPSEEKVYECIVRWISHDPKGRRKYLRLLMGYVRFGFISKNYLKQHIVEDPFLRGDAYCKDLILKVLLEEDGKNISKIKSRCYDAYRKVLLVVGGANKTFYNNLEYYDLKKCVSEVLKMPFNVCDFGLVMINRKVYVTGGWRNGEIVRKIDCYDVSTNMWGEINSMKLSRHSHAAAVLNNCIYVIGGSNGGRILNSVERFDFQTQTWSFVASMIKKRNLFGVCVLNDILYAVGGNHQLLVYNALNCVECYNYSTDTWKELRSMILPRWGLGVCSLDGKLYAIGGSNRGHCLSRVEEYDPDTDTWTIIASMKIGRAFFGVAVVDGKIYVSGGRNDNCILNSVEVYDKVNNSWTILPESMCGARSSHQAVIIDKTN